MGMLLAAIVAAAVPAFLTDWLFMGVLFHEAYNTYPEVWWPGVRDGETRGALIWSSVLGIVMTAGVVLVCHLAGNRGLGSDLIIAFAMFLAGPFALLLINFQFVKCDVWQLISHLLGYLLRFLIAGAAAGLILPSS